jgi:hypothetical protein
MKKEEEHLVETVEILYRITTSQRTSVFMNVTVSLFESRKIGLELNWGMQ